jgi:hypothetical protein
MRSRNRRLHKHPRQEAWRKTSTASGVGGEPHERRPPHRLLIVGVVAQARGGSQSGAVVAHDAGWSSEQPPERRTAGAELRHGVDARAVADGDRERERERRGLGAVQIERGRRGSE